MAYAVRRFGGDPESAQVRSPVDLYPDDFESGRLAYLAGRSQDDCPYKHDEKAKPDYQPGQRQAWLSGWLEAAYFSDYWRRKNEVKK